MYRRRGQKRRYGCQTVGHASIGKVDDRVTLCDTLAGRLTKSVQSLAQP